MRDNDDDEGAFNIDITLYFLFMWLFGLWNKGGKWPNFNFDHNSPKIKVT